jgi:hypothetical protein
VRPVVVAAAEADDEALHMARLIADEQRLPECDMSTILRFAYIQAGCMMAARNKAHAINGEAQSPTASFFPVEHGDQTEPKLVPLHR